MSCRRQERTLKTVVRTQVCFRRAERRLRTLSVRSCCAWSEDRPEDLLCLPFALNCPCYGRGEEALRCLRVFTQNFFRQRPQQQSASRQHLALTHTSMSPSPHPVSDRAVAEEHSSEDVGLRLDICDMINENSNGCVRMRALRVWAQQAIVSHTHTHTHTHTRTHAHTSRVSPTSLLGPGIRRQKEQGA